MIHNLKIWPQFYCRVLDGTKTFEVRKNDRNYQRGDSLVLQEWDPNPITPTDRAPKGYTGSQDLEFEIGYIAVLDQDTVVLSLINPKKPKKVSKPQKG
jgi:hypothetical protein